MTKNYNSSFERDFNKLLSTRIDLLYREDLENLKNQHEAIFSKAAAGGYYFSGKIIGLIRDLYKSYSTIAANHILIGITDIESGFNKNDMLHYFDSIDSKCSNILEEQYGNVNKLMLSMYPLDCSKGVNKATIESQIDIIISSQKEQTTRLKNELEIWSRKMEQSTNNISNSTTNTVINGDVQNMQIGNKNKIEPTKNNTGFIDAIISVAKKAWGFFKN